MRGSLLQSLARGGKTRRLQEINRNYWPSALPLIVLPDISPRIVTGRKRLAANSAPFPQRLLLAKSLVTAPLSPSLYGERMPAGRWGAAQASAI